MMLTLWDLIDPLLDKLVPPKTATPKAKAPPKPVPPAGSDRGKTLTTESTESTEKGWGKGGVGVVPSAPAPSSAVRPARPRRARRAKPPVPAPHPHPTQHSAAKPLIAIAEPPPSAAKKPRIARNGTSANGEVSDASMQAKYDAVVEQMLAHYGVRVRKWRKSMSGVAWYVTYRDGRMQRLIESPRPKGPMSAAVFLHEIGHHAIGFDVYKPRCLEEYHAWRWSLEAMQQHNLNITDAVRHRVHRSLWYAVQKAKRRGIKQVPEELTPFLEKPARRVRRRLGR